MRRGRTLGVLTASALLLAACAGPAPDTAPGPRHVVAFGEGGPTEVLPLDPTTLIPAVRCDPETTDQASCTVVSAIAPGNGGALAAVLRTSRGGITTYLLAGRDDDGAVWSHAPEAAPPACIGGPGTERFSCLTSTEEGSTWVVYDVATGEETYHVDSGQSSTPVVTPGNETVYSVWAGGSPQEATGTVLSLGPDGVRWDQDVAFTVPGAPVDAGYVVEQDGVVVVTGAALQEGDVWSRFTLDAGSGASRDGLPGVAALDMTGSALAYDEDSLLAGEVPLEAPPGAMVAQPAAIDDPATLPATAMLEDGRLGAYSREDGAALWETAGPFNPWAACEGVLVGVDGGTLAAVELDGGAERWSVPDAVGQMGFAWCAPGTAVVLDGGRLAGFSLASGDLAWELDLGLPEGAEAMAIQPATVNADSIVLLVLGAEGAAPDGTPLNSVITVR